jgi:chromosome segregation ATPase
MTVEELLSKFGNWIMVTLAGLFAYVGWRERTMTKVATLMQEMVRMEQKVVSLERHLEERRTQDVGILTALAEIKSQLSSLTSAVAEIKDELKHKVDKT